MTSPPSTDTSDAFSDFSVASLDVWLRDRGFPSVHAGRILHAYHANYGSIDAAELSRLSVPRTLARLMLDEISERQSTIAFSHRSADGTRKLLLAFTRGGSVEIVLMPSHRPDRAAGCLSSQIG